MSLVIAIQFTHKYHRNTTTDLSSLSLISLIMSYSTGYQLSYYHRMIYIAATLLLLITQRVQAEFFNIHKPNRTLIVLSAPSIWFVLL